MLFLSQASLPLTNPLFVSEQNLANLLTGVETGGRFANDGRYGQTLDLITLVNTLGNTMRVP